MKAIVLLTLKKHRDGVWITRLVECLKQLSSTKYNNGVVFEVRAIETWMEGGLVVSKCCFDNIAGIINRVSDAASPALFKATVAILTIAQSLGVPIVNGPQSYSVCGNKWCHHMLFTQAGLKSPATLSFWNDSSDKSTVESIEMQIKSMNLREGNSILVKPNAGGFGAGIKQTTLPLQDHDISAFEDSITLLQKFEQPLNNKLYRVWFLRGKVQCAVERYPR